MNYCDGMKENTASTVCNPCPYEYNCTKCKEEMENTTLKSSKTKYKVMIELEMETEDEPSYDFIKRDLEQEIDCACYSYEIKNFTCEKCNQ